MKDLLFGLAAFVLFGISANAQSKLVGYTHTTTEFNSISTVSGSCLVNPGFCSHSTISVIKDSLPYTGMIKSNKKGATVILAFNEAFAVKNGSAIKNNLIVISKAFSLPAELSQKLGFTTEVVIHTGTYAITKTEGIYYCTF